MKYIIYIILISFFIISCTLDEEYVETYDPEQARLDSLKQRSDDIELILSYIEGIELQTVIDTTQEGVLYSVIDSGDFEVYPENNDIISLNLAAYYTTDSIFYTNDILDLLDKEPKLLKINNMITRNEGYLKSIADDLNSQ